MKRKFIRCILNILSRLILWRYKPIIIGVAGSVGKTSTKEAIATVLSHKYSVGKNELNLNTEIGLPLTIIQGQDARRNIKLWIKNILHALYLFIIKQKDYPEILVLEMSEDAPGTIQYLVNLTHPLIGVVTAVGNPPVHLQYYKNTEMLVEEISYLPQHLPVKGVAILNADYSLVQSMGHKTIASVMTYGFADEANVHITNYQITKSKNLKHIGFGCRLEYKGSYVPLHLEGVFGRAQATALAAAAAVGLYFKMNLIDIAEALKKYRVVKGRTNFKKGIHNIWILDDSYNACPDSVRNALDLIKDIPAQRKIICLGDMKELGYMANQAHREIGDQVAKIADIFIGVGSEMKLTQEAVTANNPNIKAYWFPSSEKVIPFLRTLVKKGDLVLVKGSHVMAMDRIVKALLQK